MMVTGRIKLGAYKELSRKSLSRDQLEGFFYGGVAEEFIGWEGWHSYNYGEQLRQHLILQTIRAVAQWPKAPEMSGNRGRSIGTQPTAIDGGCGGSNPTCSNFTFYDNPSSKRVVL